MRGKYIRTTEIREKARKAINIYYGNLKTIHRENPLKGRITPEAARKKISRGMIRFNQKLKAAGKPHPLIGNKHSEEQNHRHSIAMRGKFAAAKHWHWKGGRKMSMGYIYVLAPGHPGANSVGYVREHRLIMEKMIGRLLKPSEVVHHKNRDKTDNRPENLVLFGNHKDHSNFRESQKVCPHCGGRL